MKFYTSVLQHGSMLFVSGYEDGKRFCRKVKYQPYLFVPTQKDTKYRTIHGAPVERMPFNSIWDAKQFIEKYEDVDGFHIYGMTRFNYVYIHDNYKDMKYDTTMIRTCIIDIEVSMKGGPPDLKLANQPITAITCQYPHPKLNRTFTFGLGDYQPKKDNVYYIKCKDEADILNRFIKLWSSDVYRPDVICGWNVEAFDTPYIIRRITQVLGDDHVLKLSPYGKLDRKKILNHGEEIEVMVPMGISILDYYQLYRKFTYTLQERYTLDHIATVELGEKKVEWKDKYDTLDELHDNDYELYIDYNIHDCELVKRLDDKMKLLDLVYDFAYDAGVNFIDTLSAVRTTDVIIHNYLRDRNLVVPHMPRYAEPDRMPAGAFVKEPQAGMFDWVLSQDLTSLYPHLIMGYNVSPDVFMGKVPAHSIDELLEGLSEEEQSYLRTENASLAANGCLYRRDKQGFLGALMETMFAQRKQYKDTMLELQKKKEELHTSEFDNDISKYYNLQQAKKIQLNSAYGALANPYFRWYDLKYAESITLSGQLTIRWAEKYTNKFLNEYLGTTDEDYIITVDTDSLYINAAKLVEKSGLTDKNEIHDYLEEFSNAKLKSLFDQMYQELADMMNCYKQACNMKLEVIADRGIFITKKRYILNVLSSEGVRYEVPKLKVMGIEAVRSSTPQACREAIKTALKIIMTQDVDALREYVSEFQEKFEALGFEDVAFPRGVNGMNKYKTTTGFSKGTPIHVRGALAYNKLLETKKLTGKYPLIYDGDKIRFCYLMTPNPIHSNVIACPGDLPRELSLDKYVDHEMQFEKTFIGPIQTILDAIGWKLKEVRTLERFFV